MDRQGSSRIVQALHVVDREESPGEATTPLLCVWEMLEYEVIWGIEYIVYGVEAI